VGECFFFLREGFWFSIVFLGKFCAEKMCEVKEEIK